MTKETQIRNRKAKDSGGKMIFENATLCSQFLREYSGVEILKNVRPEDIEDMTERFIPMFTEERDSDVVKKVRLSDTEEVFLITLIEHKSSVDYNVVMQLLRYMVYIWEDYERQAEAEHKGISKTKDFKYPPILPIVYYEDRDEWTAAMHLKDRIFLYDVLSEYLPDYRYLLFRLQEQGTAELIDRRDEISLVMLINRLRSAAEFHDVAFPDGYFDDISGKAPQDVLQVFSRVMAVYLRELKVPEDEISDLLDQIKERKMGRLFEHFEEFDLPAFRDKAMREGREEGRTEGATLYLIKAVRRKAATGLSADKIAGDLAEDLDTITPIFNAIRTAENTPDGFNAERVLHALQTTV